MRLTDFVKEFIKRTLEEDIGAGDVTTNVMVSEKAQAQAMLYARENGVISGLDVTAEVFRQLDKNVKIKKFVQDGVKVRVNQPLAEIKGKTRALLTGERTALNFLQHLSGIATLTRKYVDAVKPYNTKIFDTRKTIPGIRVLEKYAVRIGRGYNHRMGLYDMAMVKDNHLKISVKVSKYQSVRDFLKGVVQKLRKKISKGMKIEVETKNLKDVRDALEAGADIIMLDNMSTEMMKKAVDSITRHRKPIIEASGNVTLKNVKTIAKTGVDRISVGKLTHSAPALDISMEIRRN